MRKKQSKILSFIASFFSHLKGLFLGGLFTILPIILTIFILTYTYDFITRWLKPLQHFKPNYLQKIPGFELIIVTLLLLFLGFLLKLVFITPIVHWFEGLIKKIPFIRSVYSSSKTLVNFFNISTPSSKKRQVVMIQFPRKGLFNIGFLLEPATDNFQRLIPEEMQKKEQIYYKVFMPNSPNPTSGYFLILPEDEIIRTEMTFDEAIKAVVSCGLITPKSIKK